MASSIAMPFATSKVWSRPISSREKTRSICPLICEIAAPIALATLSLSAAAEQLIENYPWPGNVRQLSAALREAAFLSENGRLDISCFPPYILSSYHQPQKVTSELEKLENDAIVEVLLKTGGKWLQDNTLCQFSPGGLPPAATHAGRFGRKILRIGRAGRRSGSLPSPQ